MRDNEAVKMAAEEIGFDKRPKDYIQWVSRRMNRDVSNATVTKTLGRYSERRKAEVDHSLLMMAKDFFLKCNANLYYSKALLDRIENDVSVYVGGGRV